MRWERGLRREHEWLLAFLHLWEGKLSHAASMRLRPCATVNTMEHAGFYLFYWYLLPLEPFSQTVQTPA